MIARTKAVTAVSSITVVKTGPTRCVSSYSEALTGYMTVSHSRKPQSSVRKTPERHSQELGGLK